MTVPRTRVRSLSPRLRAAVRLVTFTNRIGKSVAVMQRSFVLGIEATDERRDEYRGTGVPLNWNV